MHRGKTSKLIRSSNATTSSYKKKKKKLNESVLRPPVNAMHKKLLLMA
jgi:hypothetical protein